MTGLGRILRRRAGSAAADASASAPERTLADAPAHEAGARPAGSPGAAATTERETPTVDDAATGATADPAASGATSRETTRDRAGADATTGDARGDASVAAPAALSGTDAGDAGVANGHAAMPESAAAEKPPGAGDAHAADAASEPATAEQPVTGTGDVGATASPGATSDAGRPDAITEVEPATEAERRPTLRRRSGSRRRLRFLRRARELLLRDLGGLVYEIHRTSAGRDPVRTDALVAAKVERLRSIDAEIRALATALGRGTAELVVREPGVGGTCSACGELHSSEARYCSRCGAPVGTASREAGPPIAPPAASGSDDPGRKAEDPGTEPHEHDDTGAGGASGRRPHSVAAMREDRA